jgi:hypothetical protein
MNCESMKELMLPDLDRELQATDQDILNRHLAECVDCSLFNQRLHNLERVLTDLPHVAPPFNLVDAILPKLELNQTAAVTSNKTPFRINSLYIKIASVAAVAMIFGIMLMNGVSVAPVQFNNQISEQPTSTLMESARSEVALPAIEEGAAAVATEPPVESSASQPTATEQQVSTQSESEPTVMAAPEAVVESADSQGTAETADAVATAVDSAVALKSAPQATFMNEAGTLVATVQLADGSAQFIVVTNLIGDTIFTSNQRWPIDAQLTVIAWEDLQLTYKVTLLDGNSSTFVIDTATATEIEETQQ